MLIYQYHIKNCVYQLIVFTDAMIKILAKIKKVIPKTQSVMVNAISNVQEILDKAHALKRQNNIKEAIILLESVNKEKEDGRIIHLLSNFLLQISDYQRIFELIQIQKYDPRSYAIAGALLTMDTANTQPVCIDGDKPLQNAAFVSMVKDEEDIILFNLIWHYGLGFRKFFLIDNLSTDQTVSRINLFQRLFDDAQVFVLHDPVIAHFQGKKTTGACRFLMSLWDDLEWIALVDADEFLCPSQPVHSLLSSIPADVEAIIVPKSMYHLVINDSTEDNELFFRRIKYRKPISHVSNKVIMRADLLFEVSQGNHRIVGKDGQEIKNYSCNPNFIYREFPIRSWHHFLRKIINGGKAIAEAKRVGFNTVGGNHWEALYNLYLKEGEAGLNKKFAAIVSKNSNEAIIFDPLPLDKIIARLASTKNPDLLNLLHY